MTVAVDSNVLIDILARDPDHYQLSRSKLRTARLSGGVIVGEVVFAELASRFEAPDSLTAFLSRFGIVVERSSSNSLHRAGTAFRKYTQGRRSFRCAECGSGLDVRCPRCASPVTRRQHILPDFMVGAHALIHAGRLLTRDRGYYATYFPQLVLV